MEHNTLPHHHGESMDELLTHIPDINDFQTVASVFKQLSDPTRVRIFWICHQHFCHDGDEQSGSCPSSSPFTYKWSH